VAAARASVLWARPPPGGLLVARGGGGHADGGELAEGGVAGDDDAVQRFDDAVLRFLAGAYTRSLLSST
jgi:hypothetical protein